MMQVQEELKKAAAKTQDVQEQQSRLQVDRQRLDIQLAKAKEGKKLSYLLQSGWVDCHFL